MKSTLICLHVMPREIEMLERFMNQYRKALQYLDESDDVTLKVSFNLNPLLTDWKNSKLPPSYFVDKFTSIFNDIPNINEIVLDESLMGTTQQKRESIQLEYDQFIFVDTDIAFPETLLKYQLEASYRLEGRYIIIPQLVKLWDSTWDVLVHKEFVDKDYGYFKVHEPFATYNQEVGEVSLLQIPVIKFGCGMHTLYSKQFWELVGIPESFGGYGSEDTFAMFASEFAIRSGIPTKQYLLEGIYISEDMINREPTFGDTVKTIFSKDKSRDKSWELMNEELLKFKTRVLQNIEKGQ